MPLQRLQGGFWRPQREELAVVFSIPKLCAVQARRLPFPPVLVYHHSPLSPSSVLDAALCIVLANAPQCPR